MRRAIVWCLLLGLVAMLMGAGPGARRGHVAGKYALELDGVVVGWLQSAEGGYAYSDVVSENLGPEQIVKKHIAGVKYEDITVTMGTGMSQTFFDWIAGTLAGNYARKNGAIIAADFDGKEVSRLEFAYALITEIGFPALDAASKDAAKLTVKFAPEYTRHVKGSGKTIKAPVSTKQKQWLPANFRLRIAGLEEATSRVNKIEAITIKQKVVENAVGEERDYELEAASVEIPNLVITFPESHADAVYNWMDDFVIRGNNSEEQEKSGSLEFLSPDLKEVLFRLEFNGLGLFRVAPDKLEAGSEGIRRIKAEMYCEEMRFTAGAGAR
ncbi:MAG TPA: phage tail protein [Symbiobacteriaceae bacterium]|nr:phage tail protein [Symbiobacteriaceae bacterium]